jgi:hypothetical protein
MGNLEGGGAPCLVVLAPESDRGRRILLTRDRLIVGREQSCDVRFDDLGVSRTHAIVQQHGGTIYVEDLGSTGGTFVNGAPTSALRELRPGDLLTFASVTARLEGGAVSLASVDDTSTMVHPVPAGPKIQAPQHQQPLQPCPAHQPPSPPQSLQHPVIKTRARWLTWIGVVLFLVGAGTFTVADFSFLRHLSAAVRHGTEPSAAGLYGRELGGVSLGLADGSLAVVGLMLLLTGIALHAVAAARRRRASREFSPRPAAPAPAAPAPAGPVAPARAVRYG